MLDAGIEVGASRHTDARDETDGCFLTRPIPFGEPPVLYTGEFAYRSGFWAKAIGETDRRKLRFRVSVSNLLILNTKPIGETDRRKNEFTERSRKAIGEALKN